MQQDQRIREFLSGRLLLTALDATALFVFVPILLYYSVALTAVVLFCAALIAGIIGILSRHVPPSPDRALSRRGRAPGAC